MGRSTDGVTKSADGAEGGRFMLVAGVVLVLREIDAFLPDTVSMYTVANCFASLGETQAEKTKKVSNLEFCFEF